MISRNFTPEQALLDRLLADDGAAMEELTRRYCYPLYRYCMDKLNSKEDSKRIVRNIFIALWEDRQMLPADFSLSTYLYTEVRKGVVQCINNKLNTTADTSIIEERIIPAFSATELQKAKQPVTTNIYTKKSSSQSSILVKRNYEESWWDKYSHAVSLKNIKHALHNMVNF